MEPTTANEIPTPPTTKPANTTPPSARKVIALFVLGVVLLASTVIAATLAHHSLQSDCRGDQSCVADQSMGVDFISVVGFGASLAVVIAGFAGLNRRERAGCNAATLPRFDLHQPK